MLTVFLDYWEVPKKEGEEVAQEDVERRAASSSARAVHSLRGYIWRLGRPFVGGEPLSPPAQISLAERGDFRADTRGEPDSEPEDRLRERVDS